LKEGSSRPRFVLQGRMNICSRCRKPLGNIVRYNSTFGGHAHLACPAPAVWPPLQGLSRRVYDPLIALRKLALKDVFAKPEAQALIQALVNLVSKCPPSPTPSLHDDFSEKDVEIYQREQQQRSLPMSTSPSKSCSSASSALPQEAVAHTSCRCG
jgi:hypothetical protein